MGETSEPYCRREKRTKGSRQNGPREADKTGDHISLARNLGWERQKPNRTDEGNAGDHMNQQEVRNPKSPNCKVMDALEPLS